MTENLLASYTLEISTHKAPTGTVVCGQIQTLYTDLIKARNNNLSLDMLVPNSRDWHEKMATKFFALQKIHLKISCSAWQKLTKMQF